MRPLRIPTPPSGICLATHGCRPGLGMRSTTRPARIGVSAITLAEVIYLTEKGRLATEVLDKLFEALQGEEVFVEVPFHQAVAQAMRGVSRSEVPDLPDRIIAATGVCLGAPVISRDSKIRASSVNTIW